MADNLEEILQLVWEWQEETFDTEAFTACKGLHGEIDELAFEVKYGTLPESLLEAADCFMYLNYICRKSGMTIEEIKQYLLIKLDINKEREWTKKSNGCYQHKE